MTIEQALDCTISHLMLMAQARKSRDAGWILGVAQAVHLAAAAVMSERGRDAFTDFQENLLDIMKD